MAQLDPFNPGFNSSIPTTGFFGCQFYADNTGVSTINATTFYVGNGIKPIVSKQVNTLQILNWSHAGNFESMTAELQSDSGGQPSGTVLASGTFTPTANFTWNSCTLGTSYTVTAGTQYWIVVHSANVSGANTLDIRRIDDPGAIITSQGYQQLTSSNSGSTWTNVGVTFAGCVGFGYSDSTFEGLGYGDFDTNNIANTNITQWGEYFQVPTTLYVSKIGMTIFSSAAGTPTANCTVVLQNADTSTTIESGTIVTAANITQTATWYDFTLSQTRTLVAGTNYRIYLTSAATASPQFTIRTPKTTGTGNGNAMSFGSTTDVRTNSSQQSSDHDATFRLTLTTNAIPELAILGVGVQ